MVEVVVDPVPVLRLLGRLVEFLSNFVAEVYQDVNVGYSTIHDLCEVLHEVLDLLIKVLESVNKTQHNIERFKWCRLQVLNVSVFDLVAAVLLLGAPVDPSSSKMSPCACP